MSSSTPTSPLPAMAGTDEQTMWRVQMLNDAQAFAALMARWEAPIRNLCTRMLGDIHRAQDITQEAFVRVFARRKEYRPTGRFSTFLWRIAINLCHDELRRDRRRAEVPLQVVGEGDTEAQSPALAITAAPDQAALDLERGELVRQALLRLPESHRVVVVLKHYEGLKFREIAEVLGIPEGTAKSRLADALNQLSRLLRRSLREDALPPHPNV